MVASYSHWTLFLALGMNLLICLKYSPNNWDSLTYHIPRVHFYLAQGHLGHFDTLNLRQIYFPFNATLFQLFLSYMDKVTSCLIVSICHVGLLLFLPFTHWASLQTEPYVCSGIRLDWSICRADLRSGYCDNQ